jgi:hypothetical protein
MVRGDLANIMCGNIFLFIGVAAYAFSINANNQDPSIEAGDRG